MKYLSTEGSIPNNIGVKVVKRPRKGSVGFEKSNGVASVKMGKNKRKTKKKKEEKDNKPRNKPIKDLIQKSLREFAEAKEEAKRTKNERNLKNLEISDRLAQKNVDVRRRNKERFNGGGKSPQKILKNLKRIVENQVFLQFCFIYVLFIIKEKKRQKGIFRRR